MIKFISITMLAFLLSATVKAQTASGGEKFTNPNTESLSKPALQVWVRALEPDQLRFRVQVYNPSEKLVRVSIDQDDYQTIQNDCFSGKDYMRVYNLSGLEDGIYKFKIDCGKQRIIKKVQIRTEVTTRRITQMD